MSRRRGGVSDEDRRLWSQVAASAAPLPGQVRRNYAPLTASELKPTAVLPAQGQAKPALPIPDAPRFSMQPFRIGQAVKPPRATASLAPTPAEALASVPVAMDHRTHRRMSRGKLAPEARIDLHGMTLAIAQPVLERFVLAQHSAGRRLVLVITGKGKAGGVDAPLPVRPGALRHHVPMWLGRAPLGRVVQQVTPAHFRHGGEGAYYVYLRK
ncbi:DNA mismatch repair protein MutS [Paracoccus suum]|uniref:DNA mismatch repair protein MutS n=1 Tax=Paracoccus suum TaxID=2259340 RepID=A0A344PHP7_9RHOB|nr:Smr/MutS family protein [Paracoccus suum]AXC48902.1 DNA mismatch repair protein MutS [Paracoccus suum]